MTHTVTEKELLEYANLESAKRALECATGLPARKKYEAVKFCSDSIKDASHMGLTNTTVEIAEVEPRKASLSCLVTMGYKVTDTGNGLIIDWSQA